MIINFNFTRQNSNGEIEYFNSRGQSVKTYSLSQLNKFVLDTTDLIDEEDVSNHLDDFWLSLTQDFYNAMNPNDHKANTTPQQNRGV